MNPSHAVAHNNLAAALMSQGRGEEAIQHYRMALQINLEFAAAKQGLQKSLGNKTDETTGDE